MDREETMTKEAENEFIENALKNITPIERKPILKGEGKAHFTGRKGTTLKFKIEPKKDGRKSKRRQSSKRKSKRRQSSKRKSKRKFL